MLGIVGFYGISFGVLDAWCASVAVLTGTALGVSAFIIAAPWRSL